MKQVLSTDKAPAAIGPYSQGILAGGLYFFSGQIPLHPGTGEIVGTTVAEQAEQVFQNIAALLESQSLTFAQVVKTTVFIKNMADFPIVNEIYGRYFTAPFPARSCVEVSALPKGVLIEVEIIAAQ